ncbi:hypothetical protein [uncultured Roseibium sp.]|uniref:hypothetical protein n=1 Tax=uncultured Roseibium sp. TaxID=1936171 RepID=UPI0032169745
MRNRLGATFIMERYSDIGDSGEFSWTQNSKHLLVFVHGFGHTAPNKEPVYWDPLPKLLGSEEKVSEYDIQYFTYASNKKILFNPLNLVRGYKEIADYNDISDRLISNITQLSRKKNYSSINIIAHSFGCHIALVAAAEAKRTSKFFVNKLCLIAAPNKAPWQARFHYYASFRRHKHTKTLSNSKELTFNIKNRVSELRSEEPCTFVTHIFSEHDDLVVDDKSLQFDHKIRLYQPHTWHRTISGAQDENYRLIRDWIIGN